MNEKMNEKMNERINKRMNVTCSSPREVPTHKLLRSSITKTEMNQT